MQEVSFLILCPLIFKKTQFNINPLLQNVYAINNYIKNPDIIIVTGTNTKEYSKLRKGFRIVENQIPFDTGHVEQIRLGLNCIQNNKVIIIKESTSLYNIDKILTKIEKNRNFVLSGNDKNNPGMNVIKNNLEIIAYGLENYFGDFLYLNEITKDIYNYVNKIENKKKTFHEFVNYVAGKKKICVY